MRRQKSEKLRDLLNELPHGYLLDTKTLSRYDIDYRLAHKYVKHGWLEQVARGLYRRPYGSGGHAGNEVTDWRTITLSMIFMDYKVHLGGMTALSLEGYDHYLPVGGPSNIYLHGDDIPTWLKRVPSNVSILTRSLKLFSEPEMGVDDMPSAFAGDTKSAFTPSDLAMRISHPERAILEALAEVPGTVTFHKLDVAFESLTQLRPARLQSLLSACTSVKVKRLFFVFADRHAHAWRKYLAAEDFDLGSGSRELVKGGKYHPAYHISVPGEFIEPVEGEGDDGP